MNKKVIIPSLIFLFLVGTVFAISIGQIITQEQLNNINISSLDLDFTFVRDNNNKVVYNCKRSNCEIYLNLTMILEKYYEYDEDGNRLKWDNQYQITNEIKKISFNIKPFIEMIGKEKNETYIYTIQDAKDRLSNSLKYKRDSMEEAYLDKYKSWQTTDEDISNLMNDLSI